MEERKVVEKWNSFVGCLEEARKLWEEIKEEYGGISQVDFDALPPKVAKILSIYRRAKFEVMLPRFIDFWRGQGGLQEMKIGLPFAEEEEEGKEGENILKEVEEDA